MHNIINKNMSIQKKCLLYTNSEYNPKTTPKINYYYFFFLVMELIYTYLCTYKLKIDMI